MKNTTGLDYMKILKSVAKVEDDKYEYMVSAEDAIEAMKLAVEKAMNDSLFMVVNAIREVNNELEDCNETGTVHYVNLNSDGTSFEITYLGQTLFSSENEMLDDNETYEDFIWRGINEANDNIQKLRAAFRELNPNH